MSKEFKPEYMQMSVLTAALQELTPREKRRKDPDLAVEDWIRFGRELGVHRLQLSSALPGGAGRRAAGGDARSGGRSPERPEAARRRPRPAHPVGAQGVGDELLGPRLLRQHARRRRAAAPGQARLDGQAHGRRRRPRGEGGLRVRRPQHLPRHGPEPRGLREELRAPPEGGQGPRPRVPRRAVPHARLEHHRPVAQPDRLHPRHVDPPAPHRREARRRATSSGSTTTRRTPS